MKNQHNPLWHEKNLHGFAWLGLGILLLAGCTTVQKAPVKQSEVNCGLIGKYCNMLTPGTDQQMALRYVNPSAKWSQYNKVLIDPVLVYGSLERKQISQSDEQAIINYFQQTLRDHFGKKFQIVDEPGSGVMRLSAALTDAEESTLVMRNVSMIIPQAHMLSNLSYLATGKFPFVGQAQVEAKVTDSVSGEVLGAAIDKRLGGGSITTGFAGTWGDVKNAMDFWAETLANKLSAWTSGTEKP
jgi:hypothetical protein